MKNPSDSPDSLELLQKKLAGLGEFSLRKTYYPELQERLDELAQSERFLKNIVDNIPAIVFAKEAKELRYVIFNKAAEERLGYSFATMLGNTDFDVFPAEQAASFVQQDRQVLAKGELVEIAEELVKTSRGDDLILHTKKIPLFDENGTAQYLLGISEDITARKRLEEQLLQSQKMEAIGQLAGGVAHDFNNILMVIMGYADVLKMDTGLDERQSENVQKIMSAAEKAAQLTHNLLAFSRKQVMQTRVAKLNDIVQHLQEFLGRIIGEDVQLQSMLAEQELLVDVDSGQIEQVLINLATNARDAMPQGGTLTIETSRQEIDTSCQQINDSVVLGDYACITVADSGIGMDESTRQKIFEPFFTTKGPGKGTGLGLPIVYGIIKQHKGFVNLYSERNIGTTIRIYLPLVKSDQITRELERMQPRPVGGTETILLAEDDEAVRTLVANSLVSSGYRVLLAADGEQAVAQFTAHRADIQLVLMDIVMPRLSGKAAGDQIVSMDPTARILYTSGYTMDFIRSRQMMDDQTELIMKPIQLHDLLHKVREILDRPVGLTQH